MGSDILLLVVLYYHFYFLIKLGPFDLVLDSIDNDDHSDYCAHSWILIPLLLAPNLHPGDKSNFLDRAQFISPLNSVKILTRLTYKPDGRVFKTLMKFLEGEPNIKYAY
jgi:hypothetical protein